MITEPDLALYRNHILKQYIQKHPQLNEYLRQHKLQIYDPYACEGLDSFAFLMTFPRANRTPEQPPPTTPTQHHNALDLAALMMEGSAPVPLARLDILLSPSDLMSSRSRRFSRSFEQQSSKHEWPAEALRTAFWPKI